MAGNRASGLAASKTNKEKYGEDFYHRIGKLSNKGWEANGRKPRGFSVAIICTKNDCYYNRMNGSHLIRQCAGHLGGMTSRRTKQKTTPATA